MTLTELPSLRLGLRVAVFALPLLLAVAGGGCTAPLSANGQACLKSTDCVSGICSQLVCAAASPLTDAEAQAEPEEGSVADTGTDVTDAATGADTSEAAVAETGPEASGD
jgi:hypothetical protein